MAPYEGSLSSRFRNHLPDLTSPRFVAMQRQDAKEYAREFKETGCPPWLHALWKHWQELLEEPFQGVTSDGVVQTDLYALQDEQIPIHNIVATAEALLERLDETQRQRMLFHIDSPEWRTWSNPEFLLSDKGIRLDSVTEPVRKNALALLQSSLSPEGYEKAISAMRINGFLGRLVQAPAICNEFSYNMALFGRPSNIRPWGYSFYGHHLCLNLFFYKSQVVISPWFTGAEPNIIDDGPYQGTTILQNEQAIGLRLMQSLPRDLQSRARTYETMNDPSMPPGRWNRDDQRHLCGAYRDNRVVPYEGIQVEEMSFKHQSLVKDILAEFLLYLPSKARANRLAHLESFFHTTYFSWIGGFSDGDAFYYRIQSPVIILEFDHHSGVFLSNQAPAHFHVHTLLRTPNAGDYGRALLPLIPRQEQNFVWKEASKEKEQLGKASANQSE